MSDASENLNFETKVIHAGQKYDQWSTLELIPPIVTSNTFYQQDPTDYSRGQTYTRCGNPTRDCLESCLAALDNAKHCLAYPAGCAAVTALLHLMKQGDHIISCIEQYGGTRSLLLDYTENQGIQLDFVNSTVLEEIENAIKPNTKLVFVESPSNPLMTYSDIPAISKLIRSRDENNQIIFVIDNTVLTSYFQRPLELGADVVMYSLTKYMSGHNDVLGGALILNDTELYDKLKIGQWKYGSVLPPFDSFMANRGIKTLPLRMQRHCESGIAVARYLDAHKNVVKVFHPALPSHPCHELAKKLSSGYCGVVTFQITGELAESKKFIQHLRIFTSSTSFGTLASSVTIVRCVSHVDVPREIRESLGIFDSTIRLSVGLENVNDLIADLQQALDKTFT